MVIYFRACLVQVQPNAVVQHRFSPTTHCTQPPLLHAKANEHLMKSECKLKRGRFAQHQTLVRGKQRDEQLVLYRRAPFARSPTCSLLCGISFYVPAPAADADKTVRRAIHADADSRLFSEREKWSLPVETRALF